MTCGVEDAVVKRASPPSRSALRCRRSA